MGGRQSDSFIVPLKLGNASGGKGLHGNILSEDTLSVPRNGGNNGHKIRENSRNIGDRNQSLRLCTT